jgi:hypothetical protein
MAEELLHIAYVGSPVGHLHRRGVSICVWAALCWFPGLGFRPALPGGPFVRVDIAMVGLCLVAVAGLAWVALRIGCFTRKTSSTLTGKAYDLDESRS